MRLPTWKELESVDEQRGVLEHPLDQPLFVAGPPGSGKTVLAVRRAQSVQEYSQAVVLLTYNRMLRRLLTLLRNTNAPGMVIDTAQKYVWHDYRERTGDDPPRLPEDSYAYRWPEMLDVLERRSATPNRSHLVVDEGQDLEAGFFTYAAHHISPTLSVFADEDQALRKKRSTLAQIKQAAQLPDPIMLTQNHRNTPEIARLAEHFHTGVLPAAAVRRARSGDLPRVVEKRSLEEAVQLIVTWRQTQGGTIGVVVDQGSTVLAMHGMLRERLPDGRVDFYTHEKKNEDGTNVLEHGITVLNRESVKGQEFDTVFLLELHRFLPCRDDGDKRAMYMMCSRAQDDLWLVAGPDGRLTPEVLNALPSGGIVERL